MNNLIELNQNEVSAVSGGGSFGKVCGYAGLAAGTWFLLHNKMFASVDINIPTTIGEKKGMVLYKAYGVAVAGAALKTGLFMGVQWLGSYLSATVGNICEEIYGKIRGK